MSCFFSVFNIGPPQYVSDVMHLVLIWRLALANMAVGCHQSLAEPIGSTGGVMTTRVPKRMGYGVEDMNVDYSRQRA